MNQVVVSQELENCNKQIKIEEWNIKQEDAQFSTENGVFMENLQNDNDEIKEEESESTDIKLEDLHHDIDIKEEISIANEGQPDRDRSTQFCKQSSECGTIVRCRSREFRNYSVEAMNNAVWAIQNDNFSIREASRRFGVPRGTLQDRIHGRVQMGFQKMGPGTFLSKQEEDDLENWLISITKCGFPLKKADLLNSAKSIISASDRKTPFKDNKPGQKWYSLFLKRHPKLALHESECFSKARRVVTKDCIQQWFRELRLVLEQYDALDILDDPSRIFNGEETSFSLCTKSGEVLVPNGYKNVYDLQKDSEMEAITVFLVFSANGKSLPPMVVFPFTTPDEVIGDCIPSEWVLGRSEGGWMETEIFFKYLADGFNKWIEDENISRPVLLFVDGHKSHLSMELSQYCDSLGIILYALPPHMMQPSDVFQPLKQSWKETFRKWEAQSDNFNCTLTKFTFCSLLKSVLREEKLPETIRNAFRKCGLFPFNPEAVPYVKCSQHTAESLHTQMASGEEKKVCKITRKNLEITQSVLAKLHDIFLDRGITNINAIQKELEIIKAGITEKPETFNHSLAKAEHSDLFTKEVASNSEERRLDNFDETIEDVPEKIPNKINILQNIRLYKNNETIKLPKPECTTKTTSIMQDITVSPKVNTDFLRKRLISPAPRKPYMLPVVSSAKLRKILQQKLDKHKEIENTKEKRAAEKVAGGIKKRQKKANKTSNQSTSSEKTGTCKIKEKCAVCSDDLVSDTEENDFKNVGCDQCPRWYHLKCTLFQGSDYLEIADSDFVCTFCATTNIE